jgi:micrococcal nuclease
MMRTPVVDAFQVAENTQPPVNEIAASYTEHDILEAAIVTRVIDGDTIVIDSGERVRLIGVDTPELGEPMADEATMFVEGLVSGQRVWLEPEGRDRDRFERLRRYVWISVPDDLDDPEEITNKMLNAMLLSEGYAVTLFINPGEVRHEELFIALERGD